jgi:hypothetical protein
MVVVAVGAGLLGVVEATTYWSPFQALQSHSAIRAFDFGLNEEIRFGMLRAHGSTSMPIYFGVAMALVLGMMFALRGFAPSKWAWLLACACAAAGALSSMSGGPQTALATVVVVNVFWWFPRWIKPSIVALVCLCIAAEIGSNRHFWHLIEYLNFIGGDFWYRCRLIDVALMQWHEYWLIGLGSNIPNHWGMLIDGRQFVDIVNDYVIIAITGGVLLLSCHLAIQYSAIRNSVWTFRHGDQATKQLAFGQVASLLGVIVASVSVGLFGPALILTYVQLGMMARLPVSPQRDSASDSRKIRRTIKRVRHRSLALSGANAAPQLGILLPST